MLDILELETPPRGKYISHALRIGTHADQLWVGLPLEVDLARFGWGPNGQEMAALYFDRTIKTTAMSYCLFRPQEVTASSHR